MNKATIILILALSAPVTETFCQKYLDNFYGEPIFADSLSTLFIPIQLDDALLTANKLSSWEYYANIIVYNFQTDTYKMLFDKNTFIQRIFDGRDGKYPRSNVAGKWVFLLVKNNDTNKSGRIDEKDATVLFATSTDGRILKQLTVDTENVVSFIFYLKQGFVLLKIQLDSDHDKSFKDNDKEFYLRKVDIYDLSLGNSIDMKQSTAR